MTSVPSRRSSKSTIRAFFSTIGFRVVLAVVFVAFASLGLLAWLTLLFASLDVSNLTSDQQDAVARAAATTLAVSYSEHSKWSGTDFTSALSLANGLDAAVDIKNAAGKTLVERNPTDKTGPYGAPHSANVMVGGNRVGVVSLRFAPGGIGSADFRLKRALQAAVAGSAGIVALLALLAGLAASRRITRPVVALTSATREMAAGNRNTRIENTRAPGELGELAIAFNTLADGLAREDKLRRALVADIAHELRTPLAILQASIEALADGVIEASPSVLSSLHDETLRLSRMVEDVEVLAAAEAAALDFQPIPVDLSVIVASSAQAMAAQLAADNITLTQRLTPAVVLGDAMRIRQVVTNLLANAAKFTPSGGEVELVVEPLDDETVYLIVTDTGVGIAEDDIGHVFERFWRGSNAVESSGNGIGLAIVAEIARAHGGSVTVESRPGSGSRFVVILPRA